MQTIQQIVLASIIASLSSGCATMWPLKPSGEDVARQQKDRNAEMVKSFEQKRDEAQFEAAMVRWREGDAAGCEEIVNTVLSRNPKHRGGRLLRAEMRLLEEKPELAIKDIELLVAENAGDAESAHLLGLLMEAAGRPQEALPHFERAAQLSPSNRVFNASYHTALVGEPSGHEEFITDAKN